MRLQAANYQNSFAATPHPESLFELDFTPEDTSFPEKVTGSMRSLTYFIPLIISHAQLPITYWQLSKVEMFGKISLRKP